VKRAAGGHRARGPAGRRARDSRALGSPSPAANRAVPAPPRSHQMTGGVGDYYINFDEEQPVGVRTIRGLAASVAGKWAATQNKGEVLG
jgi:hypothetical protein